MRVDASWPFLVVLVVLVWVSLGGIGRGSRYYRGTTIVGGGEDEGNDSSEGLQPLAVPKMNVGERSPKPSRQPPGAAAEQAHEHRHQHEPHKYRVDQHSDPEDHAHLLRRARAQFTRQFILDKDNLQREQKKGVSSLLVTGAYLIVLLVAIGLIGSLAWGLARFARLSRSRDTAAADVR